MRRKRQSCGIEKKCSLIVISLILCFAGQCLAQGPASQKAKASLRQEAPKAVLQAPVVGKAEPKKKPVPATSFGVVEPQDAAAFFEEARKLSSTDTALAIRLYQRGLLMKPDAWTSRNELAVLCEKQSQWNLALAEYEAINKATGSAGSYTDLVRTLDKAGYPRSAADSARKAFAKYPKQPLFLFRAGELFQKSGADVEAAAAIQEYLKLKPDDGKALILLGSIHEKAGRPADALRTYLRAEKLMKGDKNLADAAKRLRTGTTVLGGLTIFLPQGWSAEKDGIVNIQGGQRITVAVKSTGDPAALALSTARESMPRGLFSAENLKQNEQSKKKQNELARIDPEFAKKMPTMQMPFYSTGEVSGMKGAKKALLSTSETLQPGMVSAAAVAVPFGGKTYIFLWRAAQPAADGEKTLIQLLGRTVWPL